MTRRSFCILGGTGFVGHHLAARLAREGHDIRILTRYREAHRDLLVLPTVKLVEADVHDPLTLRAQFGGCDTVVNLVGIVNERGRDGRGFELAHTRLAESVVSACVDAGVERLLHMSALKADPVGPSFYLRTKGKAELAVQEGAGDRLAWTIFRPSVIFGPGDSFFCRFAGLLRMTPIAFPLACPEARFAPIYVGDVVTAFQRALDDKRTFGERYDLCGPKAYRFRELVDYTARLIGAKRRVIPLGDRLSRLQAGIMEYVPGKPFSRDNYLSTRSDSVCAGSFPEVFGFEPQPVESIVPTYITWESRRAPYNRIRRDARHTP